MVETHVKLDTTIIKVNNQMAITQIQVGKNIVEDVLIDGGASANFITKNLKTRLGLSKPRLAPYHFKMADHSMTRPLGIIQISKIHIHGNPYIATFTIWKNSLVNFNYYMLIRRP